MSFLISFNGQFSPYIHPETTKALRVNHVLGLEPLDPKEVEYQPDKNRDADHSKSKSFVSPYNHQLRTFEHEKKRFYARDIMSSPVHFIQKSAPINYAITDMKKFGFRHLAVLDGDENLVGIISDREFIGSNPTSICGEVMIEKVLVALQSASIKEIAQIMLKEKINAIPIVNDHHKVVGIVTQSDILKFVIGSEVFSQLA